MISQRDLEAELWTILNKVRRIPPSDRTRGQEPFHMGKGDAAEHILGLLDKVKGGAPKDAPKLTAAEIRHAARGR